MIAQIQNTGRSRIDTGKIIIDKNWLPTLKIISHQS